MKDVKTKRALGPLGEGGAHSAGPGKDCGHEVRDCLGSQSAQTVVGPARAPVLRKQKHCLHQQ